MSDPPKKSSSEMELWKKILLIIFFSIGVIVVIQAVILPGIITMINFCSTAFGNFSANKYYGNVDNELPKWFHEWLSLQEANDTKELNLSCNKVPKEGKINEWEIKCENRQEGEAPPQVLTLRVAKSKQGSIKEGDADLCCTACRRPDVPPTPPVPDKWNCQYNSSTLSTEFEVELKKLLRARLHKLLQEASVSEMGENCQKKFQTGLHTDFQERFKLALEDQFNEVLRETKSEKERFVEVNKEFEQVIDVKVSEKKVHVEQKVDEKYFEEKFTNSKMHEGPPSEGDSSSVEFYS